jgi:WD40 repeat protein
VTQHRASAHILTSLLRYAAASSDKTAKLWDVSTQECVRTFAGHQKAVVCLALQDVVVDDHAPSSL